MLLTDDVRACVGWTASYRSPEPLGQASIRYFALATGDDSSRWNDVAPPTLVCETCQIYGGHGCDPVTGYLGHSWDLPFPVATRLIRGGNEYTFLRPVTADDVISVTWTLVDLVEKAAFVVSIAEAVYSNQYGVRLAVNRETSLHQALSSVKDGREAAPPPGSAQLAHVSPAADTDPPDLVQRLDTADLMAYGAATWDWHRLHYDSAYCQTIGLDGPIADGQLLGALHARQVGEWRGVNSPLARLWFRNTAMVRPGDVVRVRGRVVASAGPLITVSQVSLVGERVVATGGCELMVRPS